MIDVAEKTITATQSAAANPKMNPIPDKSRENSLDFVGAFTGALTTSILMSGPKMAL